MSTGWPSRHLWGSICSHQWGNYVQRHHLTFVHANVTRWGQQAEGYDWSSAAALVGVVETHLLGDDNHRVAKRLGHLGWAAIMQPAEQSVKSEKGSHAGVMIMAKKFLATVAVDRQVVDDAHGD